MSHISDKVCSCKYCTMIDCMYGDPKLTKWEKDFVESVACFGWHKDYSDKQKAVIKKIFAKQQKIYCVA